MAWVTTSSQTFERDESIFNAVIDVAADKIVDRLQPAQVIYVRLPHQYLAGEIFYRALGKIAGKRNVGWCEYDIAQESSMQPFFDWPGPLVMELLTPVGSSSREQRMDIVRRMKGRKEICVFILRTDDMSMAESSVLDADDVINGQELCLSKEDLKKIFPTIRKDLVLERILFATGGVPGLVAAVLPNGNVTTTTLTEYAVQWAKGLVPLVANNSGLEAMMWLPLVSEYTLDKITHQFSPAAVARTQVAAALATPAITRPCNTCAGFPGVVSEALRGLALNDERLGNREAILDAAEHEHIPFPDLFRILVFHQRWEKLDELITNRAALLIFISHSARPHLLAQFPPAIPTYMHGLAVAHDLFSGEGTLVRASWINPILSDFMELAAILKNTGLPVFARSPQATAVMRELLDTLANRSADLNFSLLDPKNVIELTRRGMAIVEQRIAELVRADDIPIDDVAIVLAVLNALVDVLIDLGEIADAEDLSIKGQVLVDKLGSGIQAYAMLRGQLLARRALLAGLASNLPRASMYADYYRSMFYPPVEDDYRLIKIAERFPLTRDNLISEIPNHHVDISQLHAAHEAMPYAVGFACTYGHEAAISYVRSVYDRVEWYHVSEWQLYPLRTILALLYLQVGRYDEAEEWIERTWLPEALRELLQAALASHKNPRIALEALTQFLGRGTWPIRWRFLAIGYKLECQARLGLDPGEISITVATENWDENFGLLSLIPAFARDAIIRYKGYDVTELPGLQSRHVSEVQELSPRQMEILACLAMGKSQREVGAELGISPETVKATSKKIYRKLGVGSLHEAASVARAQGWLP